MKNYFLLLLFAVLFVSCSKTVEFTGEVKGGSPLERIEFIEASGVATLPLVNVAVDSKGKFSGKFDAPKDGMYIITYAGKENLIYLKQGQNLQISGNSDTFPTEFKIEGDAKNNNDFLQNVQKFMFNYTKNLNLQEKLGKDEKPFLTDIQKIYSDIEKNITTNAEKTKADNKVVEWKKNDIKMGILSILPQYEANRKQMSAQPNYKLSKEFNDYAESLQKDKDQLVREHPAYRNYLLTKLSEDFELYRQKKTMNPAEQPTITELFSGYLKQRKELSPITKDYLLAYVIAQSDLQPTADKKTLDKIGKIVETDIKDATIKKDLKTIQFAIAGLQIGDDLPKVNLQKQDGSLFSTTDFKGKPTVILFYASWTPYIQEASLPILKQVQQFYTKEVNFAFINFDDTQEQFKKTSKALFKDIKGTNYYAEGGLTSEFAKKFGIYGFKLQPSYLVLDKEGKVASRLFFNLGDPELVSVLDKVSGLKAPEVQPKATLQNDILAGKKDSAAVPQKVEQK